MAKKKDKKQKKFVSYKKQKKESKVALKQLLNSKMMLRKFQVILQLQNYDLKDVKSMLKILIKDFIKDHDIDPEMNELTNLIEARKYDKAKKEGREVEGMSSKKKAMLKYIDDHYDFEEMARIRALRTEFGDEWDNEPDFDIYKGSSVEEDLMEYMPNFDAFSDDDDEDGFDPLRDTGKKAAKRADKIKAKEKKKKANKKEGRKVDDNPGHVNSLSEYYLGGKPETDNYSDYDQIDPDSTHAYKGYETFEEVKYKVTHNELLEGATVELDEYGNIEVYFEPRTMMQAREYAELQMYRGVWSERDVDSYMFRMQELIEGNEDDEPIVIKPYQKKPKYDDDGEKLITSTAQIHSEEDVIRYCKQMVDAGKWTNQEADEVLQEFRDEVERRRQEREEGFVNYVDLGAPDRAAVNLISGAAAVAKGADPKKVLKAQRKKEKEIKSVTFGLSQKDLRKKAKQHKERRFM